MQYRRRFFRPMGRYAFVTAAAVMFSAGCSPDAISEPPLPIMGEASSMLTTNASLPGYDAVSSDSQNLVTGQLLTKLSEPTIGDQFGAGVAVRGDLAIVGAPHADVGGGQDIGLIYAYERSGTSWNLKQLFWPFDGGSPGDYFGAAIAMSDDFVFAGARTDDDNGNNSGSVYWFFNVDNELVFFGDGKIRASDGAPFDVFGSAIAASGTSVVITAPYDDSPATDAGSAYVFQIDMGAQWNQQAKLTASDGAADDRFGTSVAMSGDTVVVGALGDDDSGTDSGSAYVFVRGMGVWNEQAKLLGQPQPNSDFGNSVAIEDDTALVGCPRCKNANQVSSGAVFAFVRNGTTWTQEAVLTPIDGATGDAFGVSVSLVGDMALIGAVSSKVGGMATGAAYIFSRNGGVWTQQDKLFASTGASNDRFGRMVGLHGERAIVGSAFHNGHGSAFVYGLALNLGSVCATNAQCHSGYCVDGRCCNTECVGTCKACSREKKGTGADGQCGVIINGKVPDDPAECPTDPMAPCGLDGTCGGNGTCRLALHGAPCPGGSSCDGNEVQGFSCDGFGSCVQNNSGVDCAPYLCSGGACTTSCMTNADCTTGNYCDALAKCTPKKDPGYACLDPSECKSGFCTDGVCCNTPCKGPCQACTAALQGSGIDGYCGNAAEGTDPHDRCASSREGPNADPNSCGRDGLCSAGGVCRLFAAGTPCGASTCVNNAVVAVICNGLGTCAADPNVQSCGDYACNEGACNSGCMTTNDCAPAAHCNPMGQGGGSGEGGGASSMGACEPDLDIGMNCTSSSQCLSGFCVDGFCCNSACNGPCQACADTFTGSGNGFCGNAMNGTDPHGDCAMAPAESCLQDGMCNGGGLCRLYAYGTTCGSSVCIGSSRNEQICNGVGSCTPNPNTVVQCGAYACADGECNKTCMADADCAGGYRCNESQACSPIEAVCSTSDDHTLITADNRLHDCTPYRCKGNACKEVCTSVDDCVAPAVCDTFSNKCVPAATLEDASGGCACRSAPRSRDNAPFFIPFAAALLWQRRLRKSRRAS